MNHINPWMRSMPKHIDGFATPSDILPRVLAEIERASRTGIPISDDPRAIFPEQLSIA